MQEMQQGQKIYWWDQLYLTGYRGYPVRGLFVKSRKSKVRNVGIAVEMANGDWRPKWVNAENVKPR